MRVNNNKILYC